MPNTWPLVHLGELLTKSDDWISIKPDEKYRQVTVKLWGQGVVLRNEVSGAEIAARQRLRVRGQQFILSRIDARNGALGLVPDFLDGGVVSSDFPVFTPDHERILSQFLNWMSKTAGFVDLCKAASEGTTNRVRLKEDKFLAFNIPLPALDEQRRIVARIEQLAAKIQEARGLRCQAVIEAEELDAGATERCFTDLLSRGVLARPFHGVCDRITVGHVSSMRHAYRDMGVPFLRSQNVRKNRFEPQGLCFIAREFHEANPKSSLRPGEVVIVRTGFVGIACVIPATLKEANCADLVIVRAGRLLDPEYASRFLNSVSGRNRAASASVGSAQKHYNVGAMRKTQIPLPPLPEQQRIVAYLDGLQAKVDALKKRQAETAAELDALLPSILDKAFRGEL